MLICINFVVFIILFKKNIAFMIFFIPLYRKRYRKVSKQSKFKSLSIN